MRIINTKVWDFKQVPHSNRREAVAGHIGSEMFKAFESGKWHGLPSEDFEELRIIRANLSGCYLIDESVRSKHLGGMYKRLKEMLSKHGEGIL